MEIITFSEIAKRHGEEKAYDLLLVMEQLVNINGNESPTDKHIRFQKTVEDIINTNFAART